MAAGYQAPTGKPRPPSGPGKYSQRTDLTAPATPQGAYVPTDLPYGDAKRLRDSQATAPIPNRRGPSAGPPSPPGLPPGENRGRPAATPSILDLLARPTARPGEPLTAGMDVGPGPGSEVLTGTSQLDTDELARLQRAAQNPVAPPQLRAQGLLLALLANVRRNAPIAPPNISDFLGA